MLQICIITCISDNKTDNYKYDIYRRENKYNKHYIGK